MGRSFTLRQFLRGAPVLWAGAWIATIVLFGCGNQTETPRETDTPSPSPTPEVQPRLNMWVPSGSSSVFESLDPIIAASDLPYDLHVFDGPSTDAGVQGVLEGTFDVMVIMREPKPDEPLAFRRVVSVPVALFAHPDIGIDNLTHEQAGQVFSGEITNWAQLGGPDTAIVVFRQEDSDAMTTAVYEYILEGRPFAESAQIVADEFLLLSMVESVPGAVGYVFWSNRRFLELTMPGTYLDPLMLDSMAPLDPNYPFVSPVGIAYLPENEAYLRPFWDWAADVITSDLFEVLLDRLGVRLAVEGE